MGKKQYQLPEGVRYLTEAELDARKADRTLAKVERKATREGWDLGGALKRRAKKARSRRRRIPRGIWGSPGRGF